MLNKRKYLFTGIIGTAIAVTAIVIASTTNGGLLHFGKAAAVAGPTTEIGSISFVDNDEIASVYGKGDSIASDYAKEKKVILSGGEWVISAASYGQDNPTHLVDTAGYETLFFDSIWDANIANTYSLYADSMSGSGVYAQSEYLNDYTDMIAENGFTYRMAIFSTNTFTNVKDFGLFWHYSTCTDTAGTDAMGVIPLIKVVGTNDWVRPYYNAYAYSRGLIYYEYNGIGSDVDIGRLQVDTIDSGSYGRWYDSCYYYNDAVYGNLTGKEFQLGFLIYAVGAPYYMNMQFDGIIVNRHETAMKYMNGLNSETICSDGSITDGNVKKCFELLDRAFDTANQDPTINDLYKLEDYAIDSKYTNLREPNYYAQYQYLKSKLA